MNPEQLDLARRLAAHPRFQWRRGMAALYDPAPYCHGADRIDEDGWRPEHCDYIALPNGWPDAKREAWPDLTDAATGGVLWGMAGMPGVGPCRAGMVTVSQWTRGEKPRLLPYDGATLAEACARALLAEWGEA